MVVSNVSQAVSNVGPVVEGDGVVRRADVSVRVPGGVVGVRVVQLVDRVVVVAEAVDSRGAGASVVPAVVRAVRAVPGVVVEVGVGDVGVVYEQLVGELGGPGDGTTETV